MTDKEMRLLMEQSREDGCRRLFDEYCGYVSVICANKLRGCGTTEDVDECISDTFAAVFRYIESSSGRDGDLKGIIGTIARRTSIDYFRRLSSKSDRTVPIDNDSFRELPLQQRLHASGIRSQEPSSLTSMPFRTRTELLQTVPHLLKGSLQRRICLRKSPSTLKP